ncbi:MAG: hypothetical protein IKR34_02665 [Candidatus Gastranaerophilales bacterium]|nr:hypothetical protein [Candidatus Gastranaerophilales bacterium]
MTAEKVLKITSKETEVINSLYEAVCAFVEEEGSEELFESVLKDIVDGIYYEQSDTDNFGIKILKEEGE